jgi:hypothetical protein
MMPAFVRSLIAFALALSLAACAATPAPVAQMTPPPAKKLDAKSQLEMNH